MYTWRMVQKRQCDFVRKSVQREVSLGSVRSYIIYLTKIKGNFSFKYVVVILYLLNKYWFTRIASLLFHQKFIQIIHPCFTKRSATCRPHGHMGWSGQWSAFSYTHENGNVSLRNVLDYTSYMGVADCFWCTFYNIQKGCYFKISSDYL